MAALSHGTQGLTALGSLLLPEAPGPAATRAPATVADLQGHVVIMHKLYGGKLISGDWRQAR